MVFLYVGQGDATILAIPNGDAFKYVLLDNNIDRKAGGIDTAKLLKDLLVGIGKLDVFMNTHPHADHTEGLEAIQEAVGVKEVWHSGHNPGKGADEAYQEMRRVIKAIGEENEYRFFIPMRQNEGPWNTRPYYPEEIVELYLGLAMEKVDIDRIIGMAMGVNPNIAIFRAKRGPDGRVGFDRV